MSNKEIVVVHSRKNSCNGNDSHNLRTGHPLIYLEISETNQIACPYCGKIFMFAENLQKKDKFSHTTSVLS